MQTKFTLSARLLVLILAVLLPAAPVVRAGISYSPATRTIHVVGYPEWLPCTPAHLLAADRQMGWNLVAHDPAADIYTVSAHLAIGDNERTLTYFQLGGSNRPMETLAVSGNVTVAQGEIPAPDYRNSRFVTRLQIGVPDQPGIRPALKLFSAKAAPHTITVRGQLHVWHGTITAAIPDSEHMIGNPHLDLNADSLILHQATVSWVRGIMTYYARDTVYKQYRISDTVFEHGGTALMDAGRMSRVQGCTFRDLHTAILDWGSLDTVLENCRFENNRRNWHLRHTNRGLVCIDCELTPSLAGDSITNFVDQKTGAWRRPRVTVRRHVVAEVRDGQARPLAGALVEAAGEQGAGTAIDFGRQRTEKDGRTPAAGEPGAILLTERALYANDANQPEQQNFTYTFRATAADGRTAVRQNFAPTTSWAVVTLIVEKE